MKLSNQHRLFIVLWLWAMAFHAALAQTGVRRELVDVPAPEFLPHWQVSVAGGVAADVGEASLSDLLSPALQVAGTYQFMPELGARLSLSGLWARNRYAFPEAKYRWNYVQPTLELKADLASLLLGWVPDQPVSPYVVAGVGVAYSYNNTDAERADNRYGVDFQKLWTKQRWNFVARLGLGADVRLSDRLALTAEANASMLPDHFNSKRGKHDNRDWHMAALLGLRLNLGKSYRWHEPVFRDVMPDVPQQPQQPQPEPKASRDTVAMVVNIQFLINSSELRSSEFSKLYALAAYLQAHPSSHVEMTGYADRMTGTAAINERLSRERAQAVAQFLANRGISSRRIFKDAKGDRVQPFPVNEDNRVTICYVVDLLE